MRSSYAGRDRRSSFVHANGPVPGVVERGRLLSGRALAPRGFESHQVHQLRF
ncbi:MAG: hypothetical protein Greene041662_340 [Candidatus Peregrinibacteria bacterium Greene0416_62]|nr:MAG: hypothetical protein Greene041662_340 [Candidatus Peregrinibacteria bacterium Greene0416_62]TSD00295.1 MAG: hypothetical protein Greene101449_229 [Candidatus Peregrinibacteria bacterium Greene1014_49]